MVVLTGLAGCVDDEDPAAVAPETDDALATGFIRGVVVDEAIRPVESAVVTIFIDDHEAAILTTDADGNFGVGDLEPGNATVNVSKPGYTPAEVTTVVEAGVQTPDLLQITIAAVPVDTSFVWPIVWQGQVSCGTTFQNWCAAANFVTGVDVAEDTSFFFLYDEFMEHQRTPDFLQAEFLWTPNQPSSQWAYTGFWASTWEEWDECLCTPNIIVTEEGSEYLLVQAEREAMEQYDVGYTTGIGIGFSAGQAGLDGFQNNPDKTTVMVNQQFEGFFHVFYGCLPPEGWRFTEHGDPPCDPKSLKGQA